MTHETITKIKALLGDLERETKEGLTRAERALVSGLELPDIIRDVVDLLLPELKPYEAVLYMHMLRHSVAETGSQNLRVSRRSLQAGVIKSPTSGNRSGGKDPERSNASYETIRIALVGLEAIGAIRQEAEPNRDGTLYRVLLPKEIPACNHARAVNDRTRFAPSVDDGGERDFYNVRENRIKIYERDEYNAHTAINN